MRGNVFECINVLMTTPVPLTADQIQERMEEPVSTQVIRYLVNKLECSGFKTTVVSTPGKTKGKYAYKVEL